MSEPQEPAADMFAALGELVIEWNLTESWLRNLLFQFAGEWPASEILTTELGTTGVIQALQAFAADFLSVEYRDGIKHATKYFEILREYRNHYVHGMIYVNEDARWQGFVDSTSSKGRLVESAHVVHSPQIKAITAHCLTLTHYLQDLVSLHHGPRQEPRASLKPWPDKPPLPDRLEKPRMYPPQRESPLPAFRA